MKVNPAPNKRHGVDAGGAFCLHAGYHWPGTTHAGRWSMKRVSHCAGVAVLLAALSGLAADVESLESFLRGAGTNSQWTREIHAPVVIETNSSHPRRVSDFSHVKMIPSRVEIAGIHLGMSREEVLRVWGLPQKARASYQVGTGGKNVSLSYPDADQSNRAPAVARVIFDTRTKATVAMWLDCLGWYEKGSLAPKAEDCLRVLGEPTLRNYIPEPLDPRKQPPKHWYCRMVYRQLAAVLYFGDGRLIALEVNPGAKGVAPEGQGSDEYSIPFCLE